MRVRRSGAAQACAAVAAAMRVWQQQRRPRSTRQGGKLIQEEENGRKGRQTESARGEKVIRWCVWGRLYSRRICNQCYMSMLHEEKSATMRRMIQKSYGEKSARGSS